MDSKSKLESSNISEQIKFIVEKITSKLQKPIENLGRAKLIVRYILQLKAIITQHEKDSDLLIELIHSYNIFGYLIVSYNKLARYGILIDETLRCILPLLRQPSSLKSKLIHQVVEHGAAVFGNITPKTYEHSKL